MESGKMKRKTLSPRPFWLDVLILLAGTSVVGWILSLVSSVLLSDVYFVAAASFLVVSAVPIFTEMGGNARVGRQARKEGRRPIEAIQEREKSGRYDRGTRITFLFGLSGLICFILAILTL